VDVRRLVEPRRDLAKVLIFNKQAKNKIKHVRTLGDLRTTRKGASCSQKSTMFTDLRVTIFHFRD
jgi:hypothetical protein